MPEIAPHESADSLDATMEYADGVRQEAALMLRSILSFNLGGFVVAALFAAAPGKRPGERGSRAAEV